MDVAISAMTASTIRFFMTVSWLQTQLSRGVDSRDAAAGLLLRSYTTAFSTSESVVSASMRRAADRIALCESAVRTSPSLTLRTQTSTPCLVVSKMIMLCSIFCCSASLPTNNLTANRAHEVTHGCTHWILIMNLVLYLCALSCAEGAIMSGSNFDSLEADLEGKKVDVVRKRTNILFSVELEERLREVYPDRSLGAVLEESALQKLKRDGHVPVRRLPSPGEAIEPSIRVELVAKPEPLKPAPEPEVKKKLLKAGSVSQLRKK